MRATTARQQASRRFWSEVPEWLGATGCGGDGDDEDGGEVVGEVVAEGVLNPSCVLISQMMALKFASTFSEIIRLHIHVHP